MFNNRTSFSIGHKAAHGPFSLSLALQEQLLAELERIQMELDQLRGRTGTSYSRLVTGNPFTNVKILPSSEHFLCCSLVYLDCTSTKMLEKGIYWLINMQIYTFNSHRYVFLGIEILYIRSRCHFLWRNKIHSGSPRRAGSVSSLPSTLFRRSLPGSASELRYPQGGGSLPSGYSSSTGGVVVRRAHRGRWGSARDDANKVFEQCRR